MMNLTSNFSLQSYRDYHADVYPETNGLESSMGPSDWFSGSDFPVKKIDLDPKKRPTEKLVVFQDLPLPERPSNKKPPAAANGANGVIGSTNGKAPTAAAANKDSGNVRGHFGWKTSGCLFVKIGFPLEICLISRIGFFPWLKTFRFYYNLSSLYDTPYRLKVSLNL